MASNLLHNSSTNLAYHLTDISLAPVLSSSNRPASRASQSESRALTGLTTSALTAYDSASRLGLGAPLRIMIEMKSDGPLVFHSYLSPQGQSNALGRGIIEQARAELRPLSGTTETEGGSPILPETPLTGEDPLVNGELSRTQGAEASATNETENNVSQAPPLLVASVIAPTSSEAGEARGLAARLEMVGRQFQREWAAEQLQAEDHDGEDG
ncbi:hypothetical protein BJ875DRAFT_375473 [Amylocarpus encephaloides]|uniref:Uncharacterized protein n=1 Tax=Amylocarpus encephaloides TaxID=45428 RepID=A0A9P7YKS2_9HELO|nr:hypothetical protein BJ875DRAFT_375473 [Amylocarpus encephaloides]